MSKKSKGKGSLFSGLIIAIFGGLTILAGLAPVFSYNVKPAVGDVVTAPVSLFGILFGSGLTEGGVNSFATALQLNLIISGSEIDYNAIATVMQICLWVVFIGAIACIAFGVAKMIFKPGMQKIANLGVWIAGLASLLAIVVAFILFFVLLGNITTEAGPVTISLVTVALPLMFVAVGLTLIMCFFQKKIFRQ